MQTFVYPIALETSTDGGFVVSCRERMLDPKHSTKVPALEQARHTLAKRPELRIA